jgi:hypothetical protein
MKPGTLAPLSLLYLEPGLVNNVTRSNKCDNENEEVRETARYLFIRVQDVLQCVPMNKVSITSEPPLATEYYFRRRTYIT